MLIKLILAPPLIWTLSQKIFGCDEQKKTLYRSVFPAPLKLLDFGCANGNTFGAFQDFDYYGVDIDARLIRHAQKVFAGRRNAHFVCADVCSRPFPEKTFDAILFGTTGHHLEDSLFIKITRALGEMLRIGGSLHFFDTIRAPGEESWLLRLLIALDQGKFMRTEERYRTMFPTISPLLRPVQTKTTRLRGTLMPQPKYFYAELRRV
ncbi:class I SAM-dependent methyltransferase [Candidatus Peregrinibacteria bacterium]|nr:class I SAM-dependent methyltransferase [Candidatus Peregrinibacteria bacterium]